MGKRDRCAAWQRPGSLVRLMPGSVLPPAADALMNSPGAEGGPAADDPYSLNCEASHGPLARTDPCRAKRHQEQRT